MPDPNPTYYCQHRGHAIPVIGFDVICYRCTGGSLITLPASEATIEHLQDLIHRNFILTSHGWLCNKCAPYHNATHAAATLQPGDHNE